ncbi:MAG: IS1182 family transposase [Deltaproteobacteria bacterium]|nr:IS1182 family transposase [Deltaproteobacteria bacterium]
MRDYRFLPYEPDKPLLLPPDMRKWLPEDHLALFISDVVDTLDLTEIIEKYLHLEGGHPAYHPAMMLKLLFYGYCIGVRSSRRIEGKTYDDVAFRVLSCDAHPDHSRISDFRKRHYPAISRLFIQVLDLCGEFKLVKLGKVAIDGTKVKANASKHKAMSYDRMTKREQELQADVDRMLAEAEALDEKEDKKYGKGKRGDELPKELRFKTTRLEKIRKAKEALEQQARQKAIQEGKLDKDGNPPADSGDAPSDKPPGTPDPKAQRNFTDPESRIMLDGATKAFVQGFNAEIAVDCDSQIIVAADVVQAANDKEQLIPILEQIEINTGELPKTVLADNGFFSAANVEHVAANHMEPLIAPERTKHSDKPELAPKGRIPKDLSVLDRMRRKLKTKAGKKLYSKRKESVEPVFGQIKQARGIRCFLFRGVEKVKHEWKLICMTHNVLKLWRYIWGDDRRAARVFG